MVLTCDKQKGQHLGQQPQDPLQAAVVRGGEALHGLRQLAGLQGKRGSRGVLPEHRALTDRRQTDK